MIVEDCIVLILTGAGGFRGLARVWLSKFDASVIGIEVWQSLIAIQVHRGRADPGEDVVAESVDCAPGRRDESTPSTERSFGVTEAQYRKVKPPAVSAERMSPSPSVSVTASPTSRRRALRKSLSTQSGDAPQRASTAPACSSNHAKRHSF